MNKTKLGNTNIKVHAIGLGAMPLSLQGRPDSAQANTVIKAFVDAGGDFIDTANVYCANASEIGHNENLIEKALSKLNFKNKIFVATKGGIKRVKDNWLADGKPEFLRLSCENSLKALKADSIFLYQLHAPDPEVRFSDSIGELLKLKQEGKIQHIGLSNVDREQIQQALSIAPIMSIQNKCNLFNRNSFENSLIDFCEKNQITFIAHSPVGGHFEHKQRTSNTLLKRLSENYHTSTYQIMIAWLLHKNTAILPIPGASKISSVTDSLQAINIKLNDQDMKLLDEKIK